MDLKQEFLTALQRGPDPDTLLELAHHHMEQGMGPQHVYDDLQELWRELGFHEVESGDTTQDTLEYGMEKTREARPVASAAPS